jgi:MFS family permease
MFIVEMLLFVLFLILLSMSGNFPMVVFALFGTGLALGCDYPTAHMIISETAPTRARGRLVLSAFGFQAVGALAGTGVGYFVLVADPDLGAWRWMYATAILPAILVVVGRCFIPLSPHWLMARGDEKRAREALLQLLRRTPRYPREVRLVTPKKGGGAKSRSEKKAGYRTLFSGRHLRATVLAAVPWFLQDLGTYGIGIFTPTILITWPR